VLLQPIETPDNIVFHMKGLIVIDSENERTIRICTGSGQQFRGRNMIGFYSTAAVSDLPIFVDSPDDRFETNENFPDSKSGIEREWGTAPITKPVILATKHSARFLAYLDGYQGYDVLHIL
jgi:hypothetical protein